MMEINVDSVWIISSLGAVLLTCTAIIGKLIWHIWVERKKISDSAIDTQVDFNNKLLTSLKMLEDGQATAAVSHAEIKQRMQGVEKSTKGQGSNIKELYGRDEEIRNLVHENAKAISALTGKK